MNDLVAPRKILISRGFGAGWSSWEYREEIKKFALTYQPIIDFLESGEEFERISWFGNEVKKETTYQSLERMSGQTEQSPKEAEIAERKMRRMETLSQWAEPGRSVLAQFLDDLYEKFEEDSFYLGGANGLTVETVYGRVRVNEYDGAESYEVEGSTEGFI